MGILDIFKKNDSVPVSNTKKEIRAFNGADTASVNNMPYLYTWFWTANLGVPRQTDILELRKYAKSCWVQMVKNAIKKQVMTCEWDILAEDEEEDVNAYEKDVEKVKMLLNQPNRNGDTFWSLWTPFVDDVLDLDAGVIWKGRNSKGELVELFSYDGSRFLYDIDEHGIINGFYQYSYRSPKSKPIFFEKKEIIYGKLNNTNEQFPYGWSPLQSIQQEVELMIQSTRYNKEFFLNNAIPDGIVSVPMQFDQLERFRADWEQQVKGKPHKLIFHNSEADFTPLRVNNKDMEWLEGQKWYFHLVFGVYGLSPQEVGFYENSNTDTQAGQERITVKNAIKPYLKLIEDKINNDIIPDLVGHNEIKFKFFPNDHDQEKEEHAQTMAKLAANVYTINEVRAMEGKDSVEWGDTPMMIQQQERNIEATKERPVVPFGEEPKKKSLLSEKSRIIAVGLGYEFKHKEEIKESEANLNKSALIDAGEDMVEEATDYADFLDKNFKVWETKVLSFVDHTLSEELSKDYKVIDKTFGEFLSRLFNVVNTSKFFTGLKSVIKATLKEGLTDTEKELSIDIGFSLGMDKQSEILANRQLDGFYIEGKRWNGLKGVADDAQHEISKIVRDGIVSGGSVKDVKAKIKDYMTELHGGEKLDGEVTEGRVMRIARTETNRFFNHSKTQAYKESGVVAKRKWDAFLDNRTSDICERLNGQEVGLDEPFVDPGTGIAYDQPPAHPNCRSRITGVLND